MKTSSLLKGLALLAALGFTPITSNAETVSPAGKKFAKEAAIGGMMEVQGGQIAEKQGGTQAVKDFGAMMVKDHTAAGDELKAIAAKDDIKLPEKLTPSHQKHIDELAALNGEAFDKAYVPMMVEDHEKDLAEFQAAAKSLKDPDLKAFAEKTSKVIEMHLAKIKEIQASMK